MKTSFLGLLALITCLAATFANANECLRMASNDDLLRELSMRLSGSGNNNGGPAELMLTFSCLDNYPGPRLVINVTRMDTGADSSSVLSTDSSDQCRTLRDLLGESKTRVREGTTVATCVSNYPGPRLIRKFVQANGTITDLPAVSTSTSADCMKQATAIDSSR